jgi:2'-5' RNA ligase
VSPGPSPRTYGISSDLAGEGAAIAHAMWDRLEARFGLRAMRAAASPHVSFLVGESDAPAELGRAVAAIAPAIDPLAVDITGVAVFDGPSPVLYLAVARSPALVETQARLLEATRHLWAEIWPHYLPRAWTPHITLALRDLDASRLGDVLADLGEHPARVPARLERLQLVQVVLPRHGPVQEFPLGAAASVTPHQVRPAAP